ncbi:MAG TPA: pantoate--beta-alanine ligase [Euzebyales bacterium]|nr:pantoate--beta-alanine ligase [Euzebyales bacterium]
MLVTDDFRTLRAWRRDADGPVALVPTMGALHAGHLSLVAAARSRCPTVVASVFVNPLQFGPDEDLDSYPRDLPGDLDKLRAAGVDAVFAPQVEQFVGDLVTTVTVDDVTRRFEGTSRPGHFAGVATIVTKLFNVVGPDVACFGEKDYQQLITIGRMVADLDVPVEIVGLPIVRDDDGLALSSRNVRLSADERVTALRLSTALRVADATWGGDADRARDAMWRTLRDGDGIDVDYADVVDETTLVPLTGAGHTSGRALVAARVGTTRLIDNLLLALRQERRLDPPADADRASRNGPGGSGERRVDRPADADRASRYGPGNLRPVDEGLEAH